jgi:hypothetical protein
MKYKDHYDRLIDRAKNRLPPEPKEDHHIIPTCLGGADIIDNIASLTPEEHFVAHQLLVKIYPDNKKLLNALSKMCSWSYKNPRNNKKYGWIRRAWIASNSGENNPSAKFTNEQVIEIYHSNEDLDILVEKYKCIRYNIITIKRKIYYRAVTKDIEELPGFPEKQGSTPFPLPIDLIPTLFYDTGGYDYFLKTYRTTPATVRGIKSKKSFRKITSKLGTPGEVKRYGMTQTLVDEVYNAKGTNKEVAERYGIHYNTVRNIKSKYSRAFNMWEEF